MINAGLIDLDSRDGVAVGKIGEVDMGGLLFGVFLK